MLSYRSGNPSTITPYGLPGTNQIKYMYDAVGNKLQKYVKMDDCDPATGLPCHGITETRFDYIGNFVYENGELKMIYHPEGVIRPTPENAENETEFVFDYFIKDYLGNVRVVMTEEDATYTTKFLATLEDVHAEIEERNFENLEEVREDLPTGYPVNGSVSLNERIALLNAANGTEIGPSIVLPVKQGEKVSLSTEYFYTEDAAGATYDNIDFLINEVLIAFAAGGSGILPFNESQLIEIASGQNSYSNALANLFNNEIDTTDMSRPYAYMVWTAYDANMNMIPSASGLERVSNPNDLELLMRDEIAIVSDGYIHVYVSNGSAVGVNFDNFQVTTMRGKVRQINHYYPYGLTISGIGTNSDEYLNKYTAKELQTDEWNPAVSNGLEMYDFHARHYDPQLGRWFAPDPAEQFSNPYLAMGNNPVSFIDPDGEFVFIPAMIIGAMIGSFAGAVSAGYSGASNGQIMASFGIGALAGAAGGAVGQGVSGAIQGAGFLPTALGQVSVKPVSGFLAGAAVGGGSGAAGGFISGFGKSAIQGDNIGDMFGSGLDYALKGAFIGAAIGGIGGGIRAVKEGKSFVNASKKVIEAYDQDIPDVLAKPIETNCGPASGEALCKYCDIDLSQAEILQGLGSPINGVEDTELFSYLKKLGLDVSPHNNGQRANRADVFDAIKEGKSVSLSYDTHQVVVNRVEKVSIIRQNGRIIPRGVGIRVMDPEKHYSQWLQPGTIINRMWLVQ